MSDLSTEKKGKSVAENPAVGIAVFVLFLAGLLLALFLIPRGQSVPNSIGLWAGVILGFGLALLAPLTAGLVTVVRHLYLLHYSLIAGIVSVSLLLPVAELLEEGLYRELARVGMVSAGPATLAHLAAIASGRWKTSFAAALLGALLAFSLLHPAGWAAPLLFLAAGVALGAWFPTKQNAGAKIPHVKSWNLIGFLLFNLIALASLGGVLAIYFVFMWSQVEVNAQPPPSLAETLRREVNEMPVWILLALRWGGAVAGFIAGAGGVLLWPTLRPGRLHLIGGIGCLVLAGLIGGQTAMGPVLLALAGGGVLVLGATSLLAFRPRKERWTLAVLGGAVGATILFQAPYPQPGHAVWGLAMWLPEAIALALLWFAAYATGLQRLRRWEE